MQDVYEFDQQYRDSISTVDAQGKRVWVYPKKPGGYYHNLRIIVTIILLGFLFAAPLIRVNENPLMLINIFERKFILFGVPFWPQDFHIIALSMISFVVFIVLFTVVFGRVWCGWACPQTLFMEMVFRKIEYWIDGGPIKQKKLKDQPWNGEKIRKRFIKHSIFIVIALIIAHTAMAWLIGIDNVKEIVVQSPTENLGGFAGLIGFTALFYFVFSYLREQACIAICPYGRLQGVFLGSNSIAVMYDWLRGEPRGKVRKNEPQDTKGDCIDCKMCVHVCPTGIDIRNGTQLECVNCTACMDACDDIMVRMNRPKGLIRYASYNSIKDGMKKLFTTRVAGYIVVLAVLLSAIVFMVSTRSPIEATVMRVPGMLYQKEDNGNISNLYNIQFVNKTYGDVKIKMNIEGIENASIKRVGNEDLLIPAGSSEDGVFFIELPPQSLEGMKTKIRISLMADGEEIQSVKTNFLGPATVNH